MKHTFIISLVALISLGLGFILGQNVEPIEKLKIIKEQVVDTVYKTQLIKVPYQKEVKIVDTVFVSNPSEFELDKNLPEADSLVISDSIVTSDSIFIKRDQILKTESVKIVLVKPVETDTLLEKLLSVKHIDRTQIVIEFWESPVNYKGYKLSKSKLIIYGINPIDKSEIYKYENQYFLKSNKLFYELLETGSFKPLKLVAQPEFIYD